MTGPDTPKWVKSISPNRDWRAWPSTSTETRTLRRLRPCNRAATSPASRAEPAQAEPARPCGPRLGHTIPIAGRTGGRIGRSAGRHDHRVPAIDARLARSPLGRGHAGHTPALHAHLARRHAGPQRDAGLLRSSAPGHPPHPAPVRWPERPARRARSRWARPVGRKSRAGRNRRTETTTGARNRPIVKMLDELGHRLRVGEVAASLAGDAQLARGTAHLFQEQHLCAAQRRLPGSHQAQPPRRRSRSLVARATLPLKKEGRIRPPFMSAQTSRAPPVERLCSSNSCQPAQARHPYVTQEEPLTVATFRSWRGSRAFAA